MALSTFAPSIAPSPGVQIAPKVSIYKAEFGDGYMMSAPRGLNNVAQQVTLRWNGITLAQFQELNTFFTNLKGTTPFYYQVYGMSSALKWTCADWSGSNGAPFTFSAKLIQSFTLDT